VSEKIVLHAVDGRGVATVTLNRPELHNAYNGDLIDGIAAAFGALKNASAVRLVVVRANGKHFSAGADLGWLRQAADFTPEQNLDFSLRTTGAMRALMEFPAPTVALVHGACFGGGTGLVASCDIAIAGADSTFALTEVRVGVNPAPILRPLNAAIGAREARRYALTGERFDAAEARRIGLVHETAPREELDAALARIVDALLLGGPQALRETKALAFAVGNLSTDDATVRAMATVAAKRRASAEAREGLGAFLEKRPPSWAPKGTA
jgi:methylglutaconyl-CoA hydratase